MFTSELENGQMTVPEEHPDPVHAEQEEDEDEDEDVDEDYESRLPRAENSKRAAAVKVTSSPSDGTSLPEVGHRTCVQISLPAPEVSFTGHSCLH